MATRRRTSAVKSTTAKKTPRTVVKKTTVTPAKSVNKITPIEEVKVTQTPVKEEKKVTRSLKELDGLELILLPLVYLEGFVKLLLSNQF